jgi:branched-chain amino acid transport system substrate-binding protein
VNDQPTGLERNTFTGIGLSIPLPLRQRNEDGIAQAKLDGEEAARSVEAARFQIRGECEEAYRVRSDAWELAGEAANGVRGHVGLTADAPIPAVQAFAERFKKRFNDVNDHNGIKGYTAMYAIKHVVEKNGKFDPKLFAATLRGLTIKPADEPGILMEATWDKNGDIDRESFLAEIVDGKQKIVSILPKLNP